MEVDVKKINTGQDKIHKYKNTLFSSSKFKFSLNFLITPIIEIVPTKLIIEVNWKALIERANALKNSPAPPRLFVLS